MLVQRISGILSACNMQISNSNRVSVEYIAQLTTLGGCACFSTGGGGGGCLLWLSSTVRYIWWQRRDDDNCQNGVALPM